MPSLEDYAPAVARVMSYLAAEMDAASPSTVVAYCETSAGRCAELSLADLVSVTHLAACSVGWTLAPDLTADV